MAITHDYLNTTGYKPTAAEADVGELVPNLADGTLWTKNTSNVVIQLGAASGSGTTTFIQATEPAGWSAGDIWIETL